MGSLLVSAVLIVRDEAAEIADCLASLAAAADEVVVYDTGSLDRTRELAAAAGATVIEGYWDGDFGRARTAAARAASGEWLLILDADERLVADPEALRAALAGSGEPGLVVMIENAGGEQEGGGYAHWATRVVRRSGTRWVGRVHEQPVDSTGRLLRTAVLPAPLMSIRHGGYRDPEVLRRKGERNASLAQQELDLLLAAAPAPDHTALADVLLKLGRSQIGAGRRQDAVNTFEALRELAPGTRQWNEATDFLARLLLGAGQDQAVVVLSDQLREAGVDGRYCDWLRAQAMAQLGAADQALDLLRGLDELIDPGGRRYDLGQVLEVRALLASLLGHRQEALTDLAGAMSVHGRIRGRGVMLLDLWGDAPPRGLAELVQRAGSAHLPALARELVEAGGRGPAVARMLDCATSL